MAGRRRWSTIEREIRREDEALLLAGVDEVGRGPIAGPVVACAIIMPGAHRAIAGVDDSKLLPRHERERLAALILRRAIAVGVGAASVAEIDRVNIYHASVLAMRRALGHLSVTPASILIDGLPLRTLGIPHRAVVDGDDKCFSIACASIVAKVTRDRLMMRLAERYPGFSWETNAGYATPEHLDAVKTLGATPHHRVSFLRPPELDLTPRS